MGEHAQRVDEDGRLVGGGDVDALRDVGVRGQGAGLHAPEYGVEGLDGKDDGGRVHGCERRGGRLGGGATVGWWTGVWRWRGWLCRPPAVPVDVEDEVENIGRTAEE